MYSERILNLFDNMQNFGLLKGAEANGTFSDENTKTTVKIYITVENNKINDASFKAFGSIACIVCSSVAASLIVGKTLEEAKILQSDEILNNVGRLPQGQDYCLEVIKLAICDTITNYVVKQAKAKIKELKEQNKKVPQSLLDQAKGK